MIDHRREEGAVAIIVALLLVVFMAAVALTVDVGSLYLRRRALVNGADAAAMAAARTCARGGDDSAQPGGFTTPEEAADFEVQANAPITTDEVSGPAPNVVDQPSTCGLQWGHVSVRYTSQQALYFAPVMGFHKESPVTTTATASWGLGSNNPVPIVLNARLASSCSVPPPVTLSIGQVCATWYDNDSLNNGNFGFLSLNPAGWDVIDVDAAGNIISDRGCAGATSGGTNVITQWINGTKPANVALNWTDPTYVCSDDGLRKGGNSNQAWDALRALKGQIRDFPLTWEGWGSPVPGAPPQGSIYTSGKLDKYDVIGFAALRIVDVLDKKAAEDESTTTYEPFFDFTTTPLQITFTGDLVNDAQVSYTWTGHRTSGQQQAVSGTCTFTTTQVYADGSSVAWGDFGTGGGCPGSNVALDDGQPDPITIQEPVTLPGRCGTPPPDSSAVCVITEWHGDTVTGDYDQSKDNITVIRLCDLAYGTCLDQ
jgi:Flp pilus assembly protein TadG